MKLPKPKYASRSAEEHFIPMTIDGHNYTVVIQCLAGYPQTMEEPGEPASIEVLKVIDKYGKEITEQVSEKDWEELTEWFNNPPKQPSIRIRNLNTDFVI